MLDHRTIEGLLETLVSGQSEAKACALATLLASNQAWAYEGIIRRYHALPTEQWQVIAPQAATFEAVLDQLMRSEDPQVALNCIEFIRRSHLPALARYLPCRPSDVAEKIERAIAWTAVELTQEYLKARGQSPDALNGKRVAAVRAFCDAIGTDHPDFFALEGLTAGLVRALESISVHGEIEVLDTLVMLGKRGDRALIAELKGSEGRRGARETIIRELVHHQRAVTAALTVSMLGSGAANLRRTAGNLLEKYATRDLRRMLCEAIATRGAEDTRRIVRQTKSVPWLEQTHSRLSDFDDEMLLAWLAEVDELAMDVSRKFEVLQQFLECGRERVVERVFQIIKGHYTPLVRPVLMDLSNHHSESVRYHAVAALAEAQFEGRLDLLSGHLGSGSARIRSLAARSIAEDQFDRFLRDFHSLDEQARKSTGWMIRSVDPGMVDKLEGRLSSTDADKRGFALKVLNYTGVPKGLQDTVLRLASDSNRKVRAALPPVLIGMATAAAVRALLVMLKDSDSRVRANVIEAIEQLGNEHLQRALIPQLRSHDPRERANAAKAMYRLGSKLALQILEAMARNSDFRQRISAVWALAHIQEPETIALARQISDQETQRFAATRMQSILHAVLHGTDKVERARSQRLAKVA